MTKDDQRFDSRQVHFEQPIFSSAIKTYFEVAPFTCCADKYVLSNVSVTTRYNDIMCRFLRASRNLTQSDAISRDLTQSHAISGADEKIYDYVMLMTDCMIRHSSCSWLDVVDVSDKISNLFDVVC